MGRTRVEPKGNWGNCGVLRNIREGLGKGTGSGRGSSKEAPMRLDCVCMSKVKAHEEGKAPYLMIGAG